MSIRSCKVIPDMTCIKCARIGGVVRQTIVSPDENSLKYYCQDCGNYFDPNAVNTPVVAGVGADAPTVTNDRGAKQSATLYRADLLPPAATLAVAGVLKHGADKYGEQNWRGIPVNDHLNHAMIHAFAYLAGDTTDDHLEHFACRALMALEIKKTG